MVRRHHLYCAYRRFCTVKRHTVASVVSMGRYLASLHVRASKRLGGSRGKNQEYAYVGLYLQDNPDEISNEAPKAVIGIEQQSSLPARLASPSPPPSFSNGDAHLQSMDTPSASPSSPRISSLPHGVNIRELYNSFLQEHVVYTGLVDDAVPVSELHTAFQQLCWAQGIIPPPSARLNTNLAQWGGVTISYLPYETVKQAYLGLRWTSSALQNLSPSKRLQPTPCSSCEAKSYTPAASPILQWMVNEEGSEWMPWVKDEIHGDQHSLSNYSGDDSSGVLHTLQIPSPLPLPTNASPLTPPNTQASDLLQTTANLAELLEDFVDTYPYMI